MEFQPGEGKGRAETAIHRRGVAEPETMRIDKNVFPHGSRYGILDVETEAQIRICDWKTVGGAKWNVKIGYSRSTDM